MSYELVIDVRERALVRELARRHAAVSVRVVQLDVGDAEIRRFPAPMVDGDLGCDRPLLVVERKTWSDLASSIGDGRWAEQRRRLIDTVGAERVAYVIEGGETAWGEGDGDERFAFVDDGEGCGDAAPARRTRGMPSRVRGAMLSLSIGSSRIAVVRTQDVADTADLLVRAAEYLTSPNRASGDASGASVAYAGAACRASATCQRKRDNVDARQCYLQQLCQLPGVSFSIASGIASTPGFETMRSLLRTLDRLDDDKARITSLQRAPKVGRTIATRILAFFEDRPPGDPQTTEGTCDA